MIAIIDLDVCTAGTLWRDFKGVEAKRYRTGAGFLADVGALRLVP